MVTKQGLLYAWGISLRRSLRIHRLTTSKFHPTSLPKENNPSAITSYHRKWYITWSWPHCTNNAALPDSNPWEHCECTSRPRYLLQVVCSIADVMIRSVDTFPYAFQWHLECWKNWQRIDGAVQSIQLFFQNGARSIFLKCRRRRENICNASIWGIILPPLKRLSIREHIRQTCTSIAHTFQRISPMVVLVGTLHNIILRSYAHQSSSSTATLRRVI